MKTSNTPSSNSRSDVTAYKFGHLANGSIPQALHEQAIRELANYSVSFSVENRPSGSGSLIRLAGSHGILTAAHVVDDLLKSDDKEIAIIYAYGVIHRLLVKTQHLEFFKLGPTKRKDGFLGPDLAFIRLLDPRSLSELGARKSFHPLVDPVAPIFGQVPSKPTAVCYLVGAPAEKATRSGDVLRTTHFCGRVQVREELSAAEFDYLKLAVIAGNHGFPLDYGGVSGGGVWHVPMQGDPEAGPSSLRQLRPELIGVTFYQSGFSDQF